LATPQYFVCGKLCCCEQGIFYDKKNIIASVFFVNVEKSNVGAGLIKFSLRFFVFQIIL